MLHDERRQTLRRRLPMTPGELRIDPLTGHRVVVQDGLGPGGGPWAPPPAEAPARASRPTPTAELQPEAPPEGAEPLLGVRANRDSDLFWSAPAEGARERIAPDGDDLPTTVERWRERMAAHAETAACLHLVADGSSLPGADLYALSFVPAEIARERERFGAYATRTMGGNLLADLVQEEVRRRERVVAIDDEAVLLAAFAARVPYQLMLAPRTPRPRFETPGPTGARLLRDALDRLGRRLGSPPPVDLWVRTAPRGAEHFGWRIDILPRLLDGGGLELGAGLPVCPILPERAAAELRGA